MRRVILTAVLACAVGLAVVSGQTPAIVTDVRAAIAAKDVARAETLLTAYREARGVTPEMLEAHSWMGRAALAARELDRAERYARQTYELATAQLKGRTLDQERHLPVALGAAIEVLGHVDAERGARTDAMLFLRREISTYKGTSIEKRIQKNINLLSMEGQTAPALDLSEHLGPAPPTVAALKGKVVLLFFWAHWCSDCKAQAPILARLADTHRDQGLVIFAPTQRFGYVAAGKPAPPEEETPYIDQVRQTYYPVLAGQPIPLSAANHIRYGVSSTPTLVLVDRAGIVRLYNPGRMTWDELDPLVRSLLAGS